jgi:hypothetical protein
MTHVDAPSRYASYNRRYWIGWGICLLVLLLVSGGTPTVPHLGVFGTITGLAAVCVFQFEFDRYQGFIASNFPERWRPLASVHRFNVLAFFHPHLLRELFGIPCGLPEVYEVARGVFRGAHLFFGVTLVCLLVLGSRSAMERVPSFSMLGKDDVVDVHYSVQGDFSRSTKEISFIGGASNSVTMIWLNPNILEFEADTNRTILGTLSLTHSDLDKLDELVGCLRSSHSHKKVWLNFVTIVTFTHRRAGRVIATERFKNSGCGDSFHALMLRAEGSNLGDDGMKK